jgi:hypothetical protein
MPIKKKKGETKTEFLNRCIPLEVENGFPQEQAVAMCYSYWTSENLSDIRKIRRRKYLNFKSDVPHYTADGIEWTGPTHKDASGRLMTGEVHTEDSEYLYHEDELLKFETYDDYPKEAQENAKIALRWAEKNGWGSCGTPVGKVRANQLANGENISRETISRMAGFERHRQNSQKELGDGCGRLMWLAWGGDAGIEWAQRKLQQIDTENFKKWRNTPNSSNVAKIMYNDETRELVLQFNDKSIYTYINVDFNLFREIMDGNGVCRTEGKNKWGEWFIGKTPSVGAAVYERLVLSGITYKKGGSLR